MEKLKCLIKKLNKFRIFLTENNRQEWDQIMAMIEKEIQPVNKKIMLRIWRP